MKAKKTTATIGLRIERRRENGYFHIYATPVWVGLTPAEMADIDAGRPLSETVNSDRIRFIGDYRDERPGGLLFQGFTVSSQGNDTDETRHLYAWEVEYRNLYSVDTDSAVGMAKTLTTIDKRIEKMADRFGRPATFGAYLQRIANAIGASRIVIRAADRRRPEYGDNIQDVTGGAYAVDAMIADWVSERKQSLCPDNPVLESNRA